MELNDSVLVSAKLFRMYLVDVITPLALSWCVDHIEADNIASTLKHSFNNCGTECSCSTGY